jgi:hypothetical protein
VTRCQEIDDYFDKLEIEIQNYIKKLIGKSSDPGFCYNASHEIENDLKNLRKKIKEFDARYIQETDTEELFGQNI